MEFHASHQDIQGCAINDPLAAALLLDPSLVTYRDYFLSIELQSPTSKAKTIVDHYGSLKKSPNAKVAMEVNVEKFMDLFVDKMNSLK
jgi:inosine-uridine nucleoside N-ribohydrolase